MATAWPEEIFKTLKAAKVRHVAYVPDSGHSEIIRAAHDDAEMRAIPLTTEEEGIPLLAGAQMAGERGVLLMQSSGTGNCINMLTLLKICRFPFLTLVTMRGEFGEANPWQVPMGSTTEAALRLMDLQILRADRPDEAGAVVVAAAQMAFTGGLSVAVLLSQRLIGAKAFIE
jgi:sulfopyruvate decarboxylase alpha subunit